MRETRGKAQNKELLDTREKRKQGTEQRRSNRKARELNEREFRGREAIKQGF